MLVARDLSATRGGKLLFQALDLDCDRGEIIAVQGPSGSGKTTLLRILSGLDDPDNGSILLDGRDGSQWGWPSFRRALCFVHQQAVIGEGSIRDILNYPFTLEVAGQATLDERKAITMLKALNLSGQLDIDANTLSQGEKQRLALIRALLSEPKVLLLDEPTSALDESNVASVESLLKEQVSQGLTILMVTHDKVQASRLCDRILTLSRSAAQSTAQEFKDG